MEKSTIIAKDFSNTLVKFYGDLDQKPNLIRASNDIEAVMSWLEEFSESEHTHRTYQKESLRFLLWVYAKGLTLKNLKKQDIHLYRDFLADPSPVELWCKPMKIALGNKKNWTPFRGPLSERSIKISMTILSGMFTYLNHAQYLEANPFKLIKNKRIFFTSNTEEQQFEIQEKILSIDEFTLIYNALEQIEIEKIESQPWCTRARFILLFLAFTGLRVSELEQAQWSHLHQIEGRWWLKVLGKGQKLSRVPINSECLSIIKQYLDAFPQMTQTEKQPIVCQLNKNSDIIVDKKLSTRSVNFIFKKIVKQLPLVTSDLSTINKLQKFSPHWLRHFSASQQALCEIPIHFIKAHHRHSKEDTTKIYVHHEKNQAHDESEKLKILTRMHNTQVKKRD